MSSRILVQLATAKRTNVSGRLMEDHPAKRRRIEEPAEAAQATVAQTREVGQTSRFAGVATSIEIGFCRPPSPQAIRSQ